MPTVNQLLKKARIHRYRRSRLLALEGALLEKVLCIRLQLWHLESLIQLSVKC